MCRKKGTERAFTGKYHDCHDPGVYHCACCGSLAVPLLRDGGEMLLAFAAAENADLRNSAHRLLVALRGKDLGHDSNAWANWVRARSRIGYVGEGAA